MTEYRELKVGEVIWKGDQVLCAGGIWLESVRSGAEVTSTYAGRYRRPFKKEEKTVCKFEVGKEYKTRDGRTAKVYAVHPDQNGPIHGAVFTYQWVTTCWGIKGENPGLSCWSLVLPVREWEVWHQASTGQLRTFADGEVTKYWSNAGWKKIKVREVTEE